MKKAAAICLLTFYLFSTTELGQLFKIPLLVQHYLEHKASSNLTIIEFMTIHYANDNVRDADYDKDMKLPFKTHENCANIISAFISQSFLQINKPFYFHLKKAKYILSNHKLIYAYHASIWQPPKFG